MCLVLHDRLWFVLQGDLLETEWNHGKLRIMSRLLRPVTEAYVIAADAQPGPEAVRLKGCRCHVHRRRAAVPHLCGRLPCQLPRRAQGQQAGWQDCCHFDRQARPGRSNSQEQLVIHWTL